MTGPTRETPPLAALWLLSRALPPDERDAVVGDVVELFADRVDGRRRFNRSWCWLQTAMLLLGLTGARTARLPPDPRRRRFVMRLGGRFTMTFKQSARRLRYEWRYALGVIVILGVGIGPATAMLSIVQRVLLQPLAYQDPDRLGIVRINLGQIQNHPGLSPGEVIDLRHTQGLFAGVEAENRRYEVTLKTDDAFVPLSAVSITTGMLPMLGVVPVLGRPFTEGDVKDQPDTVLMDYGTWRSRFGADPGLVGRRIVLNGNPAEVVGVLPSGFRLTTGRAVPEPIDVYVPMRVTSFRNFWGLPTLVRLAPGETFDRVNATLPGLAASLVKAYPDAYSGARLQFLISPLKDDMVKTTRPALDAAIVGVLLLLAIAMANATALVIARLRTRERDFAIRLAVGAGRGSLVGDVFMESALLSACGAILGAALGALGLEAARRLIPHTVPRWDDIGLDGGVVLYAAAIALVGLFTCGLLPLWKAGRHVPWHALQSGSTRSGQADSALSRLLLAGAQIALTVVLAFTAIQLVRSAARLSEVDLGFDPNVLTFRTSIDFHKFKTPAEGTDLFERIRDRLRALPGVEAVGAVSHLPLSGAVLTDAWTTDLSKQPGWDLSTANYYATVPGYFGSMKIPFRHGRDFSDVEDRTAQHVVIVDESLARAAFPGVADVTGRILRLGWGLPDSRIVGVVGHVRGIEIAREVRPQIYAPEGLFTLDQNFTVRASGDPARLIGPIQAAVKELNTGRAVAGFAMLTDNVAAATSTLRSVTGLVSILAGSAGLLSAMGLYAVIAYLLHARRRATAIRSALGATPSQLVRLHMRTTVRVLLVALPIGVGLAAAGAPLFASLIFGVAERDPASLTAAAVIAVVASLAGTYVPVRQAAAIDPILALRSE
jgi:putative ABC transport system permease protein